MIFQHHRHQIWNLSQHPYKHSLSEFAYVNPALPGVTHVESALNWIVSVLYPNTLDAVATPADLPTGVDTPNIGDLPPTINDYRVVLDDGDGKAAAYRFEQREGEVSASWHKIYDMDWGEQSILSNFLNQTQDVYVYKYGIDEVDASGVVKAGIYAGQTIYGGASAGTNLTLNSNSGDGTGAQTGYVQVDSHFRPVQDATYDLSTATERWRDAYFSGTVTIGTGSLVLSQGSITDTSGNISFGDENLVTTGTFGAGLTTVTVNGNTLVFNPDGPAVPGTPIVHEHADGNTNFSLPNTFRAAQGIIPTTSMTVSTIDIQSGRDVGATGDVHIEIWPADVSGIADTDLAIIPNGTSNSRPITDFNASSPGNVLTFTFPTPPQINAGSNYAIVVNRTNTPTGNMNIRAHSAPGTPYAGGYFYYFYSAPPIDEANTATPGTGWDMYFSISGNTLGSTSARITSNTGGIDFDDENISTSGDVSGGVFTGSSGSAFGTLTLADGSITDSGGAISFGDENLSTTGTLGAGDTTVTRLDADNLRLDGNTLSSTNLNGNILVSADGTGIVDVQSPLQTLGITSTGVVGITGQLNIDNLRLDGNSLVSTNVNGNISLSPNGSGVVEVTSSLRSDSNNVDDLGAGLNRFRDLYLGNKITDGTNEILMSELLALRNLLFQDAARTSAIPDGATLFYDSVSGTFLASLADNEIDHGTVSGLLDDDHTQYALLNGRTSGGGGTPHGIQHLVSSTSVLNMGSSYYLAQSFTADANFDLNTVEMAFRNNSTSTQSGNAVLEIRTHDGGANEPNDRPGGVLATSDTQSMVDAGPGSSTFFRTFTFASPPSLVNGTKYWIVFTCDDQSNGTGGSVGVMGSTLSSSYTGGEVKYESPKDGGSWTASGGDFYFDIQGSIPSAAEGQKLHGGTGAGENLTLASTFHATKGLVLTEDHFAPATDGDRDLGAASTNRFRDVYTSGEFKGLRLENFTAGTLPSSSGSNVGRTVYTTDTKQVYVDDGSTLNRVSVRRHVSDTVWNGTDTLKDIDVSADITDARNAIWMLKDNSSDFEQILTVIKATSATNVRIETSPALPAGSYRLIGIE